MMDSQELQLMKNNKRHLKQSLNQNLATPVGDMLNIENSLAAISNQVLPEHLKLLKALQASEDKYVQLIQNLPAAIYMCDKEGRIILYNKAAQELWGRNPQLGKESYCGSFKIYDVDMTPLPHDQCPMALTIQTGKPVLNREIIVEKPDGTRANIRPYPQIVYDEVGRMTGAINMLVDVTDQRNLDSIIRESLDIARKNEELRRSEDRYHRMVNEVEDYAIILLDEDGVIENWNKGAEKIKGYKAEEIIGKSFKLFYTPADLDTFLPDRLLAQARAAGRATHEGWRVRKDGGLFWGSIAITALHDDDNNIVGFSKVTRDLSERKAAEEELSKKASELAKKNKELETMNQELVAFAYVSSHDLQEPLRKIQTFASRILETEAEGLSDRGKDYFSRMQNAASRMQTLIEDLLAYSRTNTTDKKFEPCDLTAMAYDVQNELKDRLEEKNAAVTIEPLPTLNGIPFQIHQLFTNIITNAIKFSKPGTDARISISASRAYGNTILHEKAIRNTDYHHIQIKDNGIGFDPEHSKKIFEVFQRLHGRSEYTGTGIGLAICKKITENHNGFIIAEGKPDQGAIFHIYLPAND